MVPDSGQPVAEESKWLMAGKILLMHAHVLRYLERGLSRQHLREFETASLSAQVFRQALHTKSKGDRDSYINSILRSAVDPGR